jgi:two-component system NarL family sensor kinase
VPPRFAVADVRTNPELLRVLLQHAYRGIRVQFLLRLILLAFMVVSIIAVPPARDRGSSALILAGYTAWTIGLGLWSRRGGEAPVRWMWLALLIDAAALSALTLVAGVASSHTWTADLLVNGFFILPMLAATQLRPAVCAAVAGPATAAYFAVSWATKAANTEPWSSILLRTSVLAGLGVGCIALSRVQLSRVLTIAGLARQRSELLNELLTVQARERAALAEQLHDGALQYVLAARHDLEDVRADGDPEALARIEFALTESSVLLRDIVSQLHPAVLQSAGLPARSATLSPVSPRGRTSPGTSIPRSGRLRPRPWTTCCMAVPANY